MRKTLAAVGVAIMATLMVGCGSETFTPDTADSLPDMVNVPSFTAYLEDGSKVKCIYITQAGYYGGTGGPSCWEIK